MIFCIAPAVKIRMHFKKIALRDLFYQNTYSSKSSVVSQSTQLYRGIASAFVKSALASLNEPFSQSALSEQLILIN